jgi:multidrug efflux system outer membrane protein
MIARVFFVSAVVVACAVAGPTRAQSSSSGVLGLRPTDAPRLITLAEAFRLAGERSLDLRLAALRVDESKAQLTQAWALVLPNISLGAEYTINLPEQKAGFGSVEQNAQQALLFESLANITAAQAAQTPDPVQRAAALEQAEALRKSATSIRNAEIPEFVVLPGHVVNGSLTAALPIFNPRAIPTLQNAMSAVEITKLSTRQAQAGVLWAVARTYYQLAATKELVAIVGGQVSSARRQRDLTTQRFDQGFETSLAVERAELDVKRAEQQERTAKAGLKAAKAALAGLLGLMDDFDVEMPAVVDAAPLPTFDALLQRAWDSRLELRLQKQLLQIAARGRTESWMRLLPSFQLVSQGRYTTNTAGFTQLPFTGAVILQGSLPIFDGGQTIGAIQASDARFSAEVLKVRQLEETIERELRGTVDDLAVKEENARTLTEVAALAKKTAENAEALYAEGVARQNDVSDARLGAFAAEVDAQRARLELETARLGLAHTLGELATLIKADDVVPAPVSPEERDAAKARMESLAARSE